MSRGDRPLKVYIPTPLRSYTGQRTEVEAQGQTIAELLEDLDRRHPGIRFRMVDEQDVLRPHIRIFVDGEQTKELGLALAPDADVRILQALSGG
jgi:molybdopterin synthase sulfur carrier subunit